MFVNRLADRLCDSALALVYPRACAICGASVETRHDGVVCSRCWDEAKLFGEADTLCWKCGVLSLAQVSKDKRETVRCRQCDEDEFTAARACGSYEGALRAAVLALKREPHVARRLARLMLRTQQSEPLNDANLIVAV